MEFSDNNCENLNNMNNQKWLLTLTSQQHDIVRSTLSAMPEKIYTIDNLPASYIKIFDESFKRNDWLLSLSKEKLDNVKNILDNRPDEVCPKVMCCEGCSMCGGTGVFKYSLQNFPVEWIEKYENMSVKD